MNESEKKILVVYFSRKGRNYSNGAIANLKQGNTAAVAEKIAALLGAKTFEIETVKDYPVDYYECTAAAKAELEANARPALKQNGDVAGYDLILLGYPNWWGTAPMAVRTFLESHDFSGKTILPFCTHGGGGLGRSEADVKKLAPGAAVGRGLAIDGSFVKSAEPAIRAWLTQEKLL